MRQSVWEVKVGWHKQKLFETCKTTKSWNRPQSHKCEDSLHKKNVLKFERSSYDTWHKLTSNIARNSFSEYVKDMISRITCRCGSEPKQSHETLHMTGPKAFDFSLLLLILLKSQEVFAKDVQSKLAFWRLHWLPGELTMWYLYPMVIMNQNTRAESPSAWRHPIKSGLFQRPRFRNSA